LPWQIVALEPTGRGRKEVKFQDSVKRKFEYSSTGVDVSTRGTSTTLLPRSLREHEEEDE